MSSGASPLARIRRWLAVDSAWLQGKVLAQGPDGAGEALFLARTRLTLQDQWSWSRNATKP